MARDTDSDWDHIGRTNPYFGVLANKQYLNPGPEDLLDFFRTGEDVVRRISAGLASAFGSFQPKSALDFGCGVGRLLIPLARQCGAAFGVDVSEPMLELSRKHCREAGVNVELSTTIPTDRTFDLVNSSIVMQHIQPSKGYRIIRQLWDCVSAGGCLALQVTAYRNASHTGELIRDLQTFSYDGELVSNFSEASDQPGSMSMYDYNFSRVFAQFHLLDGARILLEKTVHGGCHGFFIYVRKS